MGDQQTYGPSLFFFSGNGILQDSADFAELAEDSVISWEMWKAIEMQELQTDRAYYSFA